MTQPPLSPPAAPATERQDRLWLPLAIALALLSLLPVWAVEHLPLQDYPYQLARVHILTAWNDPQLDYPATFTRSRFPTPYVLVDAVMLGLARVWDVDVAGRVVVSLYLLLLPASVFWLLRSVDPAKAPFGLLALPLAFNWFLHMGFLNYALSLPAALSAIAVAWRGRERWTAGRVAGVAALVLLTYLLHLYTFGILLFVLSLLALRGPRRLARLGVVALAAAPALLLLGWLLARHAAPPGGDPHPWILLYGGLPRKAFLALATLPSLAPLPQALLFAAMAAVTLPLLPAGWRSGRPFLPVLVALALLYLALPDHVGEVFFVANRVPLLLLLLALVLLGPPRRRPWRTLLAPLLAGLALLHLALVWRAWERVDDRLADYAAALAELPADARAGFRADPGSMREGRVAPAALFGGYHYLRAPGDRIPDLEHFAGFMRPVAYRARTGETLSTAAVRSREALERLLGRRWLVGRWGWVVVIERRGEAREVAAVARPLGFSRALALGPAEVWLKTRPRFLPDRDPGPWYATGYLDAQQPSHLVVYRDPVLGAPAVPAGYQEVFRRGWARVYRR